MRQDEFEEQREREVGSSKTDDSTIADDSVCSTVARKCNTIDNRT